MDKPATPQKGPYNIKFEKGKIFFADPSKKDTTAAFFPEISDI